MTEEVLLAEPLDDSVKNHLKKDRLGKVVGFIANLIALILFIVIFLITPEAERNDIYFIGPMIIIYILLGFLLSLLLYFYFDSRYVTVYSNGILFTRGKVKDKLKGKLSLVPFNMIYEVHYRKGDANTTNSIMIFTRSMKLGLFVLIEGKHISNVDDYIKIFEKQGVTVKDSDSSELAEFNKKARELINEFKKGGGDD